MKHKHSAAMRDDFICPACLKPVEYAARPAAYCCRHCDREFPVLFGIPDFRLTSDRYLSLAEERDKARRLYEFGRDHSFDELIDEYYRITDDVPPAQALKFASYVRAGVARGATILPRLGPPGTARLLDIGCGAGGLLAAAAGAGYQICGTDIALRWLVIAAKRLEELGLEVDLVCADVAALPFTGARFTGIAAIDLFEHVEDTQGLARVLGQMLTPNGKIYLAAANRYTLAPYPLAGLFGVGFMPRALRRRYIIARRGLDTLRYAALQSPVQLSRLLRRHEFCQVRTTALEIPVGHRGPLRGLQKIIFPLYSRLRSLPLLGRVLVLIGPAFEITGIRRPEPGQPVR